MWRFEWQRKTGSVAGHSCSCVVWLEVVYRINLREGTDREWLKVRMNPSTPAVMNEHWVKLHIPSWLFAKKTQSQNNSERQAAKLGSERGDKNIWDTISGYRWVSCDSSLCGSVYLTYVKSKVFLCLIPVYNLISKLCNIDSTYTLLHIKLSGYDYCLHTLQVDLYSCLTFQYP